MKGIVLEIHKDRCVLLKADGSFVRTKNRNYQIGQQVSIRQKVHGLWLPVAASVLMLCAALVGWFTPTSYLYMDINPSLRLEVNCLGQVVSAVALNEDAQHLLEAEGSPTGNLSQCMEQLLSGCRSQGYIPEGGADLELHLCTEQAVLAQQVQQTAQQWEEENVTVSVYTVSREENKKMLRSGMSPKRLDAVKQYTTQFGGTLEENMAALKGIATNEIFRKIRQSGGTVSTPKDASYVSARRKKAVRVYTDQFGGTLEENMENLRGLSLEEIHTLIREGCQP